MKTVVVSMVLGVFFLHGVRAQTSLADAGRRSVQTFVYRISADTAEKYLNSNKPIGNIDQYLSQPPTTIIRKDEAGYYADYTDTPSTGNYLFLSVEDNELVAEYVGKTNIQSFIVNNGARPQLFIRNADGVPYTNASVWVNKKPAVFIPSAGTYQISQKNADDAIVKIAVPGDTAFVSIDVLDDNYRRSVMQQRLDYFRGSRIGWVLNWLPLRIKYKIKYNRRWYAPRYWFGKHYHYKRNWNTGYIIFNKPKYFPSDTVKFKAYVLNPKGRHRQYKKDLNVFLNYYNNGESVSRKLTTLKPVSPGAYVYQFATGDTLPNDTKYTIKLQTKKGVQLQSDRFSIEDYLLKEVSTYTIKSQKDDYFLDDTMVFSVAAKDANGLPLMDGRAKLILTAKRINDFYADTLFIPDTLWQEEKPLEIEGDTKFVIPASKMPSADLGINARVIFKNSNNEIEEKETDVSFTGASEAIHVWKENGQMIAEFLKNGQSVAKKGSVDIDPVVGEKAIEFPYAAPIDPHAESYFFSADGDGKEKIIGNNYNVKNEQSDYDVSFSRWQQHDTVGFTLNNPEKIRVYYTVFNGNKKIAQSSGSEAQVVWQGVVPKGRYYTVKWQYFWAGEEQYRSDRIGLLTKLLATEIKSAETIYPGQTDTITLRVKDQKEKEATDVNLTAVSYNSQFADAIQVPEPPYMQRFRGKAPLVRNTFETNEAKDREKFLLGDHQAWRQRFGLDIMEYYKFLFPQQGYYLHRTLINDLLPQVSVFAVQKGVPQEIYLLYVNRQLAYYDGVTDSAAYAFQAAPGYTQLAFRTRNRYVEIDSIYLQPSYKHDIVFDLDKLPANAVVQPTDTFWTGDERRLLEDQILRIESSDRVCVAGR